MVDALSLVPARTEDSDFLLTLRNDPAVVAASRTDRPIDRVEHEAWLNDAIESPQRRLFIVRAGTDAIGQARLDGVDDGEWVSIALVPEHRGHGHGIHILHLLQDVARGALMAEVRLGNLASLALFESAGFELETSSEGFATLRWFPGRDDGVAPIRRAGVNRTWT